MKVYELDKNLCSYLLETLQDYSKTNIWSSSTISWGGAVKNHIYGSCLLTKIPEDIEKTIIKEIFKYLPNFDEVNCLAHIWQPYSGISLHNDHNHTFAATIYLNHFWDVDWGGNFMFYTKEVPPEQIYEDEWVYDYENWRMLVPQFGTMVLNDNYTPHFVSSISPSCPELRYTIQVFAK